MESENNNLKKIIIPIVIVAVILLIVIAYFIINHFNNDDNKDNVLLNSELENTKLYATEINDVKKERKIVAVTDNKDKIEIYKASDYSYELLFEVVRDKMYIALIKQNDTTFGYIDLNKGNGNYEFVKLREEKSRNIDNVYFAALDNKLYYQYIDDNSIYEYDMKIQSERKITTCNTHCGLINSIDDDIIVYYKDDNAYSYNITSNKETKIADNATIYFTREDNLIYSVDDKNTEGNIKSINSYNVKSNTNKELFTSLINDSEQALIPYENGYIYVDGNKINKYDSNKISTLYEFEGSTDYITLLLKNTLSVITTFTCDNDTCYETKIFDLEKNKVVENAEYQQSYYYDIEYINK